MPADSRDDLPGGARHPAGAARARRRVRRRRARADPRQRAHARRPPRRPARAARGEPARASERLDELLERRGRDVVRRGVRRGRSPTPSGARARRSRDAARRRRTRPSARARGRRRRPTTTSRSRVAVDDRRRRAARSTSPAPPTQVAGNVNCPLAVTRSACYFALRVLLPADVPANAGTYAPLEHRGARGLARQRAPPGRRRGRQRRDLAARSPTPCSPRSPRRSTLPAAGPGDDEQPRSSAARGWTYYETIGGGQGASAAGAGPVAACTSG